MGGGEGERGFKTGFTIRLGLGLERELAGEMGAFKPEVILVGLLSSILRVRFDMSKNESLTYMRSGTSGRFITRGVGDLEVIPWPSDNPSSAERFSSLE